jgi:hypothetical protein
MSESARFDWPLFIRDRAGRRIYIAEERWQHALDHPGMHEGLLKPVLETIGLDWRKQDPYDPAKYKYSKAFAGLPDDYTHIVVVVKFGALQEDPTLENNFVLTNYLVERWAR